MKKYNVELFQGIVNEDIEWRVDQLAFIKQNAVMGAVPKDRLEVIIRYSPVLIYALFEGFITKITTEYINTINAVPNKISAYCDSVINRELEIRFHYHMMSTDVNKRTMVAREIRGFFGESNVIISSKVETASNVNLKTLNSIFNVYHIRPIDEFETLLEGVKVGGFLNKLLKFRNSIAHGEVTIQVTVNDVDYFANNLIVLFDTIEKRYVESLNKESFLLHL